MSSRVELTPKEQVAIWGLIHSEYTSRVSQGRPEDVAELAPILRKIGPQGCNLLTVSVPRSSVLEDLGCGQ